MINIEAGLRNAPKLVPLALAGALTAEAVQANTQPQRDALSNSAPGNEFYMERGIPNVREGLNALGLDLLNVVEAQQNPDFCSGYQFCTNFDLNNIHHTWRATNGGSDPDCPDGTAPRIDVLIDGVRGSSFYPNKAFYPEVNSCAPNGGGIALAGDILVDPGLGKAVLTTVEKIVGTTEVISVPRGGELITDLLDPGNLSKRVKITDSGLLQRVTNNGGESTRYVNRGGQVSLVRQYPDAYSSSSGGDYNLLGDNNGNLVGSSWTKELSTQTPEPTKSPTASITATPTTTLTTTVTRTPTSKETPVANARTFGLTEMSSTNTSTRLQTNWSQRTDSIGTKILDFSSQGTILLPVEGLLPPSQTSFTHELPSNMTGLVCEGPLFFMNKGTTELISLLCDYLGTKSGVAPEGLSISSDITRRIVTLEFRGLGGQTGYTFLELPSGRATNIDGSATSISFSQTEAVSCYVGLVKAGEQIIGNTSIGCAVITP